MGSSSETTTTTICQSLQLFSSRRAFVPQRRDLFKINMRSCVVAMGSTEREQTNRKLNNRFCPVLMQFNAFQLNVCPVLFNRMHFISSWARQGRQRTKKSNGSTVAKFEGEGFFKFFPFFCMKEIIYSIIERSVECQIGFGLFFFLKMPLLSLKWSVLFGSMISWEICFRIENIPALPIWQSNWFCCNSTLNLCRSNILLNTFSLILHSAKHRKIHQSKHTIHRFAFRSHRWHFNWNENRIGRKSNKCEKSKTN